MSAIAGLVSEPAAAKRPALVRQGSVQLAVREVSGREWDRIISGFDTVCKEQFHAFAVVRWPGVSLEPRVYELGGRIVGGVLMMVQRLPLGVGRIAIAKWGPMLADSRSPQAATIYNGMIDALVSEYAEQRGMMISILPLAAHEAQNRDYRALLARGFKPGAALPYPARYLVNVRLSQEEQRKSFAQTWRRQLKRAEQRELTFEHASADRLDEFKTLYTAMTDRKQFRDHSAYETLDSLMELDHPARPELFFVRHGGALVAGALVFKAGDRAAYLYGATNDLALPLQAGFFLHWHVIGWLRDHTQASWYDLGGTDGYSGLHQFKKGMVGEKGAIRPLPPVMNYAARPLAYWLGAGAMAVREVVNEIQREMDARHPSGVRPDMPRQKLGADDL